MSNLASKGGSSEDLGPRAHSTSAFRDGTYGGFAAPIAPSQSTPNFAETGVSGSRLQHRRFSQQLYGQLSPLAANRVELDPRRLDPRVYSMLPLDTVNADGVFRYAGSAWFAQALQLLVSSGTHGVAIDLWWGAIEKSPGQYNWTGYKQALEVIKQTGLKVQAVLSFHACGGNVGDTAQITLPDWVLQCGAADPDLFFADRPRNGGLGNRNREYISIWADDAPGVLRGRSPMQCYEDFMSSLRENFSQDLGTVIDEVVIGAGPCGELRLPSYVEANGWRFPGAGEFQCYDRRALASLAQAAREAGHPEWGYTGPHDAGEYNSMPELTGFFSPNGSWNTPYGRFFLEWYSGCLIRHGDRLLSLANQVFASKLASQSAGLLLQQQGSGMALHSSSSQQFNVQPLSSNLSSGGRVSTMSLNRILETGGSSNGNGGDAPGPSSDGGYLMAPPPGLPLRRQPDAAAAVHHLPNCTCSTCAGGVGCQRGGPAPGSSLAASPRVLSMYSPLGDVLVSACGTSASGRGAGGASASGSGSGNGSGSGSGNGSSGSGSGANGVGAAVGAAVARGVTVVAAACTAAALVHGGDGDMLLGSSGGHRGVGGGGSVPRSTGSGSAHAPVSGVTDAFMADVEPSDASHTSMGAPADMLPAPPLSDSGSHSHRPSAAAAAVAAPTGPSLAAMRFRSSTSTLAEGERLYGRDAAGFAAASAVPTGATLVTVGGAGRMDLCTSLSSLSTEFTTTTATALAGGGGGGRQAAGMRYLDVAASLVRDGDDDGSDGTSCCTSGGGVAAEADDLFVMAAAPGRRGSSRTSEPGAPGPLSDEGVRTSQETLGGLGLGSGGGGIGLGSGSMGMAAAAAAVAAGAGAGASLLSPTASCSVLTPSGGGGLHLALKIAGIHWWYRSRSHAAELTAGYYNVEGRDGYAAIVEMCARHRANLVLTCVEMCDAQHPQHAQCGPEGLLRQLRQLAARSGVALSGENALPIFSSGGVDTDALDRVVQNMRACSVPGPGRSGSPALMSTGQPYPAFALTQQYGGTHQLGAPQAAAAMGGSNIVCVGYRMSELGRMVPVGATAQQVGQQQEQAAALQGQLPQYQAMAATAALPMYPAHAQLLDAHMAGFAACASPAPPETFPALRAFTFLRLVPEMLLPGYQGLWLRFMGKLLATS